MHLSSAPDAAPEPARLRAAGPWVLLSKPGRTLFYSLLFALLAPLAIDRPGLRWWPEDLWALAPKALRPGSALPADPQLTGEIDEAELLSLGRPAPPAVSARPIAAPRPERAQTQPSAPPQAAAEPAAPPEPLWPPLLDAPAPPALPGVIESDADLPPPPALDTLKSGLPLMPIEDPQGTLRRLYSRLARIEAGAPDLARVVHYGDSLITGDYVTGTMRHLMQTRFGDGGHGFILAGMPAPWYRHNNVKLRTSDDWQIYRLTRPSIRDRSYGLGAATFTTTGRDWIEVSTDGPKATAKNPDPIGVKTSRMQVFYLAQPKGGRFSLKVDQHTLEVNTRTEEKGSRQVEIQAADGPHTLRVQALGGGEVRLFGAILERDGPGVVYDSLGLDGTRAKLLSRMNAEHWYEQLRLRKADLVVLHYGANESQTPDLSEKRYREDLMKVVGGLRAALPGVGCLLVGPMDRAERTEEGFVSMPVIERITRAQRQVAYTQGCAFWNTYAAMGGSGSMATWYKNNLAQSDLTHPSRKGADRIGAMLFAALMHGYEQHQRGLDQAARPSAEDAPEPPKTPTGSPEDRP